jgi:hypothetical protein
VAEWLTSHHGCYVCGIMTSVTCGAAADAIAKICDAVASGAADVFHSCMFVQFGTTALQIRSRHKKHIVYCDRYGSFVAIGRENGHISNLLLAGCIFTPMPCSWRSVDFAKHLVKDVPCCRQAWVELEHAYKIKDNIQFSRLATGT